MARGRLRLSSPWADTHFGSRRVQRVCDVLGAPHPGPRGAGSPSPFPHRILPQAWGLGTAPALLQIPSTFRALVFTHQTSLDQGTDALCWAGFLWAAARCGGLTLWGRLLPF